MTAPTALTGGGAAPEPDGVPATDQGPGDRAAATGGPPTSPPADATFRGGGGLGSRVAWSWSGRRRRRVLDRPARPPAALGRQRFPGTDADTELHAAVDAYGRPFGMVLVPATGHATLALSLRPPGDDLLDVDGAQGWISDLGVWLALLAHEPHLAGCTVSVLHDPATDPAEGPAEGPAENPAEDPPQTPLQVTVHLTWRTLGPQGRADPAALAVELGARLPQLVRDLRRCEAGTAVPLRAEELARTVAAAYDPAGHRGSGGGVAAGAPASWSDAGPQVAAEAWDRFRHDSAVSLTWSLSDVPPSLVLSGVLAQLASAHAHGRPGAARTRVALLHRPGPTPSGAPASAGDWTGLPASSPPAGAPDPVPHLTSLVTVSVTGPGTRLDDAVQGVLTGVAPSLRPWLRPLYGSQAAAFAAALPSGTLLGVHTAAPTVIREVES